MLMNFGCVIGDVARLPHETDRMCLYRMQLQEKEKKKAC
jgi:hypothetical protein